MTPTEFRAARLSFGLTQPAWGQLLGIKRAQVAHLEAGRRNVTATLRNLIRIYQASGLPPQTDEHVKAAP